MMFHVKHRTVSPAHGCFRGLFRLLTKKALTFVTVVDIIYMDYVDPAAGG